MMQKVVNPKEAVIEAYLVKRIQGLGGEAMKFTSLSRRSVPDRIVMMPGGKLVFVELKRLGKQPTESQEREHQRLRELGQSVYVIDSKAGVDMLVMALC